MSDVSTGRARPGPIRVVLADDHPIWRDGIKADLDERFEVVGEAGTGTGAIDVIAEVEPDLVVCDLHMPDGGGLAVAKACGASTCVIVLTVSEAERDLLDAVAAGARGYLLKNTPGPDLVDRLAAAADGEPQFSPSLAALVLGEFRRMAGSGGGSGTAALTDREREVLSHVARGHTYREIGEDLHIAAKTVENHVRNILDKLHLNKKAELIRYAADHDIT